MKIGIIGTGNVGGGLGSRWAKAGHQVIFSSRNPDSEAMKAALTEAGANARAAKSTEAVAASEVLLLAIPWQAAREALAAAGDLAGKTLIDATNPLLADLSGLELGTNTSAAEQVAQWAPGAKVVKAFNTVGSNVMADSRFGDHPVVLFYCGDDDDAKKSVHELASQLGFDPHDAGPLSAARLLEPFALLWITLALKRGYGREFAFELLRR